MACIRYDGGCTKSIIEIDYLLSLKLNFLETELNPYRVLGVSEDMDLEDIKKVYRRKRREFHPDTLISKGLPEELLERAKEKFIEIQEAYESIEKNRFR